MRPIERLVDANNNRAREGLRVLEDLARFVLDRADLAEASKHARHALAAACEPFDPHRRLLTRDTPGDVGTTISTPAESQRPTWDAVAAAAAGRATEALRMLEEAAKLAAVPSQPFETLRYEVYSLERDLRLALPSGTCPQWRLCVLITRSLCAHHDPETVADLAIRGGADAIQLREKSLPDDELLSRARTLRAITDGRAHLVINDRPDIALLADADAIHLGQTDLSPAAARQIVGSRCWIGRSCSTLAHARDADGADYIGVGPMFPSTTKPKDAPPGPALLRDVVSDSRASIRPHLAISGITADTVAGLVAAGCRGIAVCGAVCGAEDPESAARALRATLGD